MVPLLRSFHATAVDGGEELRYTDFLLGRPHCISFIFPTDFLPIWRALLSAPKRCIEARMKKIVIVVSDESYRLLQNHPDRPRQRWGRQNVPEFYAAVLQMGMDSDQFKLREAEARNRSLALTVQWQEARSDGLNISFEAEVGERSPRRWSAGGGDGGSGRRLPWSGRADYACFGSGQVSISRPA